MNSEANSNSKLHIIVDSACDMLQSEANALDITILPLKTLFGSEEYLDGVTLSHSGFYEKLIENDQLPTTSQIPPYEYETIFEKISLAGDTALVITLSSKLSGSYQSACIAADDYKDCVYIVDSENVCIGEQILLRLAIQLRDKGLSASAIVAQLNACKSSICILALLDTLEYLKRGGRISATTAFAGRLLSIKPVITIVAGEVAVLGKARGSRNGNNMLIELIQKNGGINFNLPFTLGYSGLDDSLLQKYLNDSKDLWEPYTDVVPVSTIGSTIGTHVGPGAIAVAFFHS